ncbi:MAG: ABC transporter ATP-binding protein [Solirubrobacteraceae bacterium]
MTEPLLDVRDLRVTFLTDGGDVTAVDGVSFALGADEVLGIVGESGSGKSVTMMSVMRLVPERNTRFEGEVHYGGRDLMQLSQRAMREVRGSEIAMIFQDPMTSLNPVYRVGWQIAEQVREHEGLSAAEARDRAVELLRAVGIPDAEQRVDDFPHHFSGGMRQRVMIAMALSCRPRVLIADEPTTALDVTIQAQILDLIRTLRRETGSSVVLITHDMGVVAELADRVQVMYGGRVVEQGPTRAIFHDPLHPYTWGLLGSIARLDRPRPRRLTAIGGAPQSASETPAGCVFADRCPYRFERCSEPPPLEAKRGPGHLDACHLPLDVRPSLREAAA